MEAWIGHQRIHPDGHEDPHRRLRARLTGSLGGAVRVVGGGDDRASRLLAAGVAERARQPGQVGDAGGYALRERDQDAQPERLEPEDVAAAVLFLVGDHEIGLEGGDALESASLVPPTISTAETCAAGSTQ